MIDFWKILDVVSIIAIWEIVKSARKWILKRLGYGGKRVKYFVHYKLNETQYRQLVEFE